MERETKRELNTESFGGEKEKRGQFSYNTDGEEDKGREAAVLSKDEAAGK